MPEGLKISQSVSPVIRVGAGDISERELSRERSNLATPPARIQRVHHRKLLFSTPVNKFTAKSTAPNSNLARIRSCLDEYQTPPRSVKIRPKAVSMEDLTPTKRVKREGKQELPILKSPRLIGVAEEQAAVKIAKFMLLVSWRRRRDEIRCVRKTLEFQVSCSERLRIQVCVLKSLLDSDNAKVRLAMRELERLKQLLKDKDMEKALLEKEKHALEQDVCSAEDRASEISIGWRDTRHELELARAALASSERARALELAALSDARASCEQAGHAIETLEEDLSHHETQLLASEAQVTILRNEINNKEKQLEETREELDLEKEARGRCLAECSSLSARVSLGALQTSALSAELERLRATIAQLERERREWWPRPLTRMLRSWFHRPMSLPEAMLWSLIPARHGC